MPDSNPTQAAGTLATALNWLVIALMLVAIIYSLVIVAQNWSYIKV